MIELFCPKDTQASLEKMSYVYEKSADYEDHRTGGAYLAECLLGKDYEVHGIKRIL